MKYAIVIRSRPNEPLYRAVVAARLAGVRTEFLIRCEKAGLIEAKPMIGGGRGYDIRSIRELSRIRRLYEVLELDLESIELILHLRRQILDLQKQLVDFEDRARREQRRLETELLELRHQLARQAPQKTKQDR